MKEARKVDLKQVREMLADYMRSEGCSCCRNIEKHKENKERLAKLLGVPKYSDGSGYDFGKFRTVLRGEAKGGV